MHLMNLASAEGITLGSLRGRACQDSLGEYDPPGPGRPARILVDPSLPPPARAATLAHELGHHLTSCRDELALDDEREERLAEGFAAVLLAIAAARA